MLVYPETQRLEQYLLKVSAQADGPPLPLPDLLENMVSYLKEYEHGGEADPRELAVPDDVIKTMSNVLADFFAFIAMGGKNA